MTNEERDIQRKLRVPQHAERISNARRACRYFGIGRSSFYRWRDAYQKHGEAGLKNTESIPKNPVNQTPAEIVEKVLYLRRKYHLGPIRIVWYLARYHSIKISDPGVYRILKRTVSTDCPEAHGCINCTPKDIRNNFQSITSKWTLSF